MLLDRVAFFYWHDSQVGSSMPQNFTSVALITFADAIKSAAPESEDTRLSWPAREVDFSACVAPMVRK